MSDSRRAARFVVVPIALQIQRSTAWTFPTKALPVAIPTPTDTTSSRPDTESLETRSTISRAAATAACSLLGRLWGAPNTAMNPSPWNSTTLPRCARTVWETACVYSLTVAKTSRTFRRSAVDEWKRNRRATGIRDRVVRRVTAEQVFAAEELAALLDAAESAAPEYFPLLLFLAHTGARLGEGSALRWTDLDLRSGTARIARSFSSGKDLGPTKTGHERTVELSEPLQTLLEECRPDLFPPGALVFPSRAGGFVDPSNFRRAFHRLVRRALGPTART